MATTFEALQRFAAKQQVPVDEGQDTQEQPSQEQPPAKSTLDALKDFAAKQQKAVAQPAETIPAEDIAAGKNVTSPFALGKTPTPSLQTAAPLTLPPPTGPTNPNYHPPVPLEGTKGNVGDEIDKNGVKYRYDGLNWQPVGGATPTEQAPEVTGSLNPTSVAGNVSKAVTAPGTFLGNALNPETTPTIPRGPSVIPGAFNALMKSGPLIDVGKAIDAKDPISRGLAKFATGMVTPQNLFFLGATGPFEALPPAWQALASGVFSYQMAKGLWDKIPEFRQAIARNDWDTAIEIGAEAAPTAAMSFFAAKHSLESQIRIAGQIRDILARHANDPKVIDIEGKTVPEEGLPPGPQPQLENTAPESAAPAQPPNGPTPAAPAPQAPEEEQTPEGASGFDLPKARAKAIEQIKASTDREFLSNVKDDAKLPDAIRQAAYSRLQAIPRPDHDTIFRSATDNAPASQETPKPTSPPRTPAPASAPVEERLATALENAAAEIRGPKAQEDYPSQNSVGDRPSQETKEPTPKTDEGTARQAVESVGGKYVGIQNNYGVRPDDVMFQPEDGGSTLHVPLNGITPEAVKAKIASSPAPAPLQPQPQAEEQSAPLKDTRPLAERFPAQTVSRIFDEARMELADANRKWQAFERPGRYVSESGYEPGDQQGSRPEVHVTGIPSARHHIEAAHPWMASLPGMTAGKLNTAIQKGKGAEYTRLLNAAAQHVATAHEAAKPVIEKYHGQLLAAAASVANDDPEMAQTLRDLADGAYAGPNLADYLEEKLNEANAAADFFQHVSELSTPDAAAEGISGEPGESDSNTPEAREPDSEPAPAESPANSSPAAEVKSSGPPTLPGMAQAVADQKEAAAQKAGEDATAQFNRPPESIDHAAGEMEAKSPLFEGTGASPQSHMFAGNPRKPSATTQPKRPITPKKISNDEILAEVYKPGNIVRGYGGGSDRVISYTPPTYRNIPHPRTGKPSKDLNTSFSVKVQGIDREGNPIPNDVRTHSTYPDKVDVQKAQKAIEARRAESNTHTKESPNGKPLAQANNQPLESAPTDAVPTPETIRARTRSGSESGGYDEGRHGGTDRGGNEPRAGVPDELSEMDVSSGREGQSELGTKVPGLPDADTLLKQAGVTTEKTKDGSREILPAYNETRPNGLLVKNGKIMREVDGEEVPEREQGPAITIRLKDMLRIRNAARELFTAALRGRKESVVDGLKDRLKAAYQEFVDDHGKISARNNSKLMMDDPDMPMLLSVEKALGADGHLDSLVNELSERGKNGVREEPKEEPPVGTFNMAGFLNPAQWRQAFPSAFDRVAEWSRGGTHEETITPGLEMKSIIREETGARARSAMQIRKAVEDRVRVWNTKSKEETLDFVDRIMHGQQQPTPELQADADAVEKMIFEPRKDAIEDLPDGSFDEWREHYFPGMWNRPGQVSTWIKKQLASKRPLAGSGAFRKHKVFEDWSEAIKAGFEPVSWNPFQIALLKADEMDKYIMGHTVKAKAKDAGLAKFVRAGVKRPDGWAPVDDRIFTATSRNASGITEHGKWYMPTDAATVINNYLSPGISGKYKVAYDAVRFMGNSLNSAELGLSAFHLTGTAVNSIINDSALALERSAAFVGHLTKGQFSEAATAAKGAAQAAARALTVFGSPINTLRNGDFLMKEYLNPGSAPEYAKEADALTMAGGRSAQGDEYTNQNIEKIRAALKTGGLKGYLKAALRLPFAAIEASAIPTMQWAVPRMKMGAFYNLANDVLARADREGWTHAETAREVQRIWNSIDSRMGQVVTDNIFVNKIAKQIAYLALRSAGWTGGTISEGIGAAKDTARQLGRVITGQAPTITHRMAYTMTLALTMGYLGAIANYAYNGKAPATIRDLYQIPTGKTNQDGTPERVNLPSYMKDGFAYQNDPVSTAENKMSPMFSTVAHMLTNKDFYGTEIRHPDDPLGSQLYDAAQYVAKQYVPFTIENAMRRYESGEKIGGGVQSLLGITPAPKYATQTAAEKEAQEYSVATAPPGTRTKAQFEHRQVLNQLSRQLRDGEIGRAELSKMVADGNISNVEATRVLTNSTQKPLEREFQHMQLDEAMKIWKVANEQERDRLLPMLRTKKAPSYLDAQTQDALEAERNEAMQDTTGKSTPVQASSPAPTLDAEISRLERMGMQRPGFAPTEISTDEGKVQLNRKDRSLYQRIHEAYLESYLKQLFGSPEYKAMKDEDRVDEAESAVREARDDARDDLLERLNSRNQASAGPPRAAPRTPGTTPAPAPLGPPRNLTSR